ncbi:sterol desaturase [Pseudomonas sp. GM21]|uniref:sterol desaturase family protein n=1 Tax=Pseudomonas sp. GM21 TaxID=1144325 RepID=UPI0002725EC2|nr:sterol desaturase family protein [Pseudomonas sp. GM21]EJM24378.1 sterol desaturase [Pseudomonas sp. GM21]
MKLADLVHQAAPLILGVMSITFLAELMTGRLKPLWNKRDMLLTVVCFAVVTAVTQPLTSLFWASSLAFLLPGFAGALAEVPVWLAFPLVLLIDEFCFYWVHRAAHDMKKHPWLYKMHRTHHSANFMNLSVYFRVNVFWVFVVPHAWVIGIALYLGMTKAAALTLLTVMLWNIFTHSDIRWDAPLRTNRYLARALRIFESVIVTPSMHHTHHGYGKDGMSYRNYAVFLSLFDKIFGTIHHPVGRPARYGLPGQEANWLEQAFFPLVQVNARKPESARAVNESTPPNPPPI